MYILFQSVHSYDASGVDILAVYEDFSDIKGILDKEGIVDFEKRDENTWLLIPEKSKVHDMERELILTKVDMNSKHKIWVA